MLSLLSYDHMIDVESLIQVTRNHDVLHVIYQNGVENDLKFEKLEHCKDCFETIRKTCTK